MDIDERLEALTHTVELMAGLQKDNEERHDREMAELRASQEKTERTLRRAIRLSVENARRQRKRNVEFESGIARLNNALAAFLERGGNGKH